jgi:hypothetical protein
MQFCILKCNECTEENETQSGKQCDFTISFQPLYCLDLKPKLNLHKTYQNLHFCRRAWYQNVAQTLGYQILGGFFDMSHFKKVMLVLVKQYRFYQCK